MGKSLSEKLKLKAADLRAQSESAEKNGRELRDKEAAITAQVGRIPAVDIGSAKVNTAVVNNKKVLAIDPVRCRPWKLHNRKDSWLIDESLRSLADSIKAVSQRQYGLVRKLDGDPDYDYEVIYGLRRCSACRLAGELFKAEVTNASDAECYRLMHIENEESRDVSPLEKAISYKRALVEGVYESEQELIATLGLKERHYRKIRQLGELEHYPSVFGFALEYLPLLSFRVAERLLAAADKVSDQKSIGMVVDKLKEDLVRESTSLGENTPIDILTSRLELCAGKPKPAVKPESVTLLVRGKRPLMTLQRSAKGQLTLKVDGGAKDDPSFEKAIEQLLVELRK